MKVASLIVVEGVGAAWGGSVVAGRLVSERCECEAVRVEKRGCESPWLVGPTRRRVLVLDVLGITEMAVAAKWLV